MNIVVVQDFLRSGGTERQSILLAQAFAAAGHRATLVTFRPGGALAATVDATVDRRVLQPWDTGLDWLAPGLVRTVRGQAPDVVLCMGRMANCYAGRLQTGLPGATVVATMRTGKPLPWLFRRSLRRVRHVVANCHEARDTLLRHHGVAADRVSVIYNSLVFPPVSAVVRNDALRAELGAGPGTIVLLCVAMFRPEKRQRELIEIAAGLPTGLDWQLWLAGDGPTRAACERFAEHLRTASATDANAARIKFLGWQRDPTPFYRAADVAVHASSSEALSNFLIEAQAHGLPGVAYAAQGIGECFVPGDTGWVIARDDRAGFRARIAALAGEDAAARAVRATRAQACARATFDRPRQVSAYLELFRRLVSSPAP